jgi:hypothetical protein
MQQRKERARVPSDGDDMVRVDWQEIDDAGMDVVECVDGDESGDD